MPQTETIKCSTDWIVLQTKSVQASIILFPGSFYGYLSPTGNYYIMLFLFYGYLSPFDWDFGVSSVERGFILLCFLCYGYQSLGEIYYTSFFLTLLHKNRMANNSVQASIILFPGSHAIQFAQEEMPNNPRFLAESSCRRKHMC